MTAKNEWKTRVVAYIPARLGSERVPRKNLRLLGGAPLITYATKTALRTTSLDRVYVNTESQEIADIAASAGAAIYMRRPELASASATTDEILYDFAKSLDCGIVVVINPTAPFLKSTTIDRVMAMVGNTDPHATIFTTTRMRKHLILDGQPGNFACASKSPRTQDLTPFEYINFVVLAISRAKIISQYERSGYCLYSPPLVYVPMSGLECHDIDDEDDFLIAEAIMAKSRSDRMSLASVE